jgi:hypothetical protein
VLPFPFEVILAIGASVLMQISKLIIQNGKKPESLIWIICQDKKIYSGF